MHVFDSCSTDGTAAFAQTVGAHVTSRIFDDWSTHRNWGLSNIDFRNEWVLCLNADERVTQELADEIMEAVRNPANAVAFRIARRDVLHGRRVEHSQTCLSLRLFKPQCIRYERHGYSAAVMNGSALQLLEYIEHWPLEKGLARWFARRRFPDVPAERRSRSNTAWRG
jgi:glycosyltransferase involved in cell wall biosynthesis